VFYHSIFPEWISFCADIIAKKKGFGDAPEVWERPLFKKEIIRGKIFL